jgi:hypothetical protein
LYEAYIGRAEGAKLEADKATNIAHCIGRLAELHARDALVASPTVPKGNGKRFSNLHGPCGNRAPNEEAVAFDDEGAVGEEGAGHASLWQGGVTPN